MPATAGGVVTDWGALNPSPPDRGAEEGRGVDVKISNGFFSDHVRCGVENDVLKGCSRGVRSCGSSGGGFKALRYSGVLILRLSGSADGGVAPVNIDLDCVGIERPDPPQLEQEPACTRDFVSR